MSSYGDTKNQTGFSKCINIPYKTTSFIWKLTDLKSTFQLLDFKNVLVESGISEPVG